MVQQRTQIARKSLSSRATRESLDAGRREREEEGANPLAPAGSRYRPRESPLGIARERKPVLSGADLRPTGSEMSSEAMAETPDEASFGILRQLESEGGGPLSSSLLSTFGRQFGRDLGEVRVHQDHPIPAAQGVPALTVGRHIAFAPDRYRPGSARGDELIAHETSHVIQQTSDQSSIEMDDETAETEAANAAGQVIQGESVVIRGRVPYGSVQANDDDDEASGTWPPRVGMAYQLNGMVVQPPEGQEWREDEDRDMQVFAMILKHLMGSEYNDEMPGELKTFWERTGGHRFSAPESEEMVTIYVELSASLTIIAFVKSRLIPDYPISQLPEHANISPEQLELLRLGWQANIFYYDLTNPQVAAEISDEGGFPPWYVRELFVSVVASEGDLLRRHSELSGQLHAGEITLSDAHAFLAEALPVFLTPARVIEAVRQDESLGGWESYRSLWNLESLPDEVDRESHRETAPETGPINLSLAHLLIGFIWTQPAVKDAILAGETATDREGYTPTEQLLVHFMRFTGRMSPESIREQIQDQILAATHSDRNANPLPSELSARPPLEPPYFDTAMGTDHRFVLDVQFSDIYEELANQFGGFGYYWEMIRVPSNEWADAETVHRETAAGEGTTPTIGDMWGVRLGRTWDYAMADLETIEEQEERMGAGVQFLIDTLGPPGGAYTLSMVNSAIRVIGTVISSWFETVTMPRNEHPFVFPEEGLYVVRGYCQPELNDESEYRRAASVAWLPVNSQSRRSMGRTRMETMLQMERQKEVLLTRILLRLNGEEELTDEERQELIRQRDALTTELYGSAEDLLTQQRTSLESERERLRAMSDAALSEAGMTSSERNSRIEVLNQAINSVDMRLEVRRDRAEEGQLENAERLRATMVTDLGNTVYPLIEVAETAVRGGRHFYYASDITSPTSSRATGAGRTRKRAIKRALENLFESYSAYGRGDLTVFIPVRPGSSQGSIEQIRIEAGLTAMAMEAVENITTVASLAAMVAAPFTGGASLSILVPIGIVGAMPAAYRIADRYSASTFRLDLAMASDMVDVVSSLAGIGQMAAGTRFVRTAKFLAFVGYGGDGFGVVAVSYNIFDEANRRDPNESEGQRRARIAQAFARGFQTFGMMGLGSALSRRYGGSGLDEQGRLRQANDPDTDDSRRVDRRPGDDPEGTETTPRRGFDPDQDIPRPRFRRDVAGEEGLPSDLRGKVRMEIDPNLTGDTVRVHYDVDDLGLITDVVIRRASGSDFRIVDAHFNTARQMTRFRGVAGYVRRLYIRFTTFFSAHGDPLPGTRAFEAHLEVQKLPEVIQRKLDQLDGQNDRQVLNDIRALRRQLAEHEEYLDSIARDPDAYRNAQDARRGFVAGESMPDRVRMVLDVLNESRRHGELTTREWEGMGLPQPHSGDAWVLMGRRPPRRLAYRGRGNRPSETIALAILDGNPIPPPAHNYRRSDGQWILEMETGAAKRGIVPQEVYTTPSGIRDTRPRRTASERLAVQRYGEEALDIPDDYYWKIENGEPRITRVARERADGTTIPRGTWVEGSGFQTVSPDVHTAQRARLPDFEIPESVSAEFRNIVSARETARTQRAEHQSRFDSLADDMNLSQADRDALPGNLPELRRRFAGDQDNLDTIDALEQVATNLTGARREIVSQAERLGDRMGEEYILSRHPDAVRIGFDGEGQSPRARSPGAGEFDQVWWIPGDPGQIIVVETKGAGSTLGERTIGGERHQQGTRLYLQEIARLMEGREGLTQHEQDILTALNELPTDGPDIRYLLIEAPVGTSGGRPYARPGRVSEWDVTEAGQIAPNQPETE